MTPTVVCVCVRAIFARTPNPEKKIRNESIYVRVCVLYVCVLWVCMVWECQHKKYFLTNMLVSPSLFNPLINEPYLAITF